MPSSKKYMNLNKAHVWLAYMHSFKWGGGGGRKEVIYMNKHTYNELNQKKTPS